MGAKYEALNHSPRHGYDHLQSVFSQMFDNPATRPQLQALYNAEQSLLSFEGQQMQVTLVNLTSAPK